jgi:hypothetical protein
VSSLPSSGDFRDPASNNCRRRLPRNGAIVQDLYLSAPWGRLPGFVPVSFALVMGRRSRMLVFLQVY